MKLHIFDFDGTLANTPENTLENQKKFEKHFGVPWLVDKELSRKLTAKLRRPVPIRRGWWGREESLMPPLVPDPVDMDFFNSKVVEDFLRSKNDENCLTLILTGRHQKLKHHVLRILNDVNLIDVTRHKITNSLFCHPVDEKVFCYCLGDNGPALDAVGEKPSETFPWKVWIIKQYLHLNPDFELIEIWEDRAEHVENFESFGRSIPNKLIVHHVRKGK